jgi:hypothetical protein
MVEEVVTRCQLSRSRGPSARGHLDGHLGRPDLALPLDCDRPPTAAPPAPRPTAPGPPAPRPRPPAGSDRRPGRGAAPGLTVARLEGVPAGSTTLPAVPVMDANTRHIGCSASQRTVGNSIHSAQVLEMAATWKDTTKRITVYPAKGQTAVPVSFNRCQEHPTPFGGACAAGSSVQTVGYVVTIQVDGYYAKGKACPCPRVQPAPRSTSTARSAFPWPGNHLYRPRLRLRPGPPRAPSGSGSRPAPGRLPPPDA